MTATKTVKLNRAFVGIGEKDETVKLDTERADALLEGDWADLVEGADDEALPTLEERQAEQIGDRGLAAEHDADPTEPTEARKASTTKRAARSSASR